MPGLPPSDDNDRGEGGLACACRKTGEPVEFRGQRRPRAGSRRACSRRRRQGGTGVPIHGLGARCEAVIFINPCPLPCFRQRHVLWIMCTTLRVATASHDAWVGRRMASQLLRAPEDALAHLTDIGAIGYCPLKGRTTFDRRRDGPR